MIKEKHRSDKNELNDIQRFRVQLPQKKTKREEFLEMHQTKKVTNGDSV